MADCSICWSGSSRVPRTSIGRTLASIVMIMGYSIIAVPAGIVTSKMSLVAMEERKESSSIKECSICRSCEHDREALFCKLCGGKLKDH